MSVLCSQSVLDAAVLMSCGADCPALLHIPVLRARLQGHSCRCICWASPGPGSVSTRLGQAQCWPVGPVLLQEATQCLEPPCNRRLLELPSVTEVFVSEMPFFKLWLHFDFPAQKLHVFFVILFEEELVSEMSVSGCYSDTVHMHVVSPQLPFAGSEVQESTTT